MYNPWSIYVDVSSFTSHPLPTFWLWLITLIIIGELFVGHIWNWCEYYINESLVRSKYQQHEKFSSCWCWNKVTLLFECLVNSWKMMNCSTSDLWLFRWYKSKWSHERELYMARYKIIYYHYTHCCVYFRYQSEKKTFLLKTWKYLTTCT